MAKLWKSCPVFGFTLLFLLSLVLTIVILVGMCTQIPYYKALKIVGYCVAILLTTCLVTLLFIIVSRIEIYVCTRIVWISLCVGSWSIIINLIKRQYIHLYYLYLYDDTEKILVYCIISLLIMCTVFLMDAVLCNPTADTQAGNPVLMGDLGSSNHGFTGDSSGGGGGGGCRGGD